MLVSPVLSSVLAAALLLLSSSSIDAAKTPAFMMDKKLRSTNTEHQQRLLANLMAKAQPRRQLDQGNDDQAQQEEDWDDFGFEVDQYSVKYTGCSAIKTYSDEQAEDGNVIQAKRFVVFRLCPSDTCNKYTTEGCSEDYGEYVLEMGDYLETMAQYQEERNQNYCEYCEACVDAQMGNNNNRRRLDQGDDAAAADGDDAAAADGDDAVAAQGDDAFVDCYEVCSDYNSICNENNNQANGDDAQEQQEEVNIQEFFECVGVQNENNGNQYFLGPHCDNDGFTIVIGLYSDEECNTYIGHEYDVYQATGIDLSEVDMSFFYPHDCYSCQENVSKPYLCCGASIATSCSNAHYLSLVAQEFQWENNDEDNQDEDNVNEMCENLYMGSAKCNTNFDTVNENAYYVSFFPRDVYSWIAASALVLTLISYSKLFFIVFPTIGEWRTSL